MSSLESYNPDILTCLANLSNDEVFTPPSIANAMLDLIPKEFWSNPNVKVLDPAVKSGVFLREAAKRFLDGLEPVIPDLQERIDHIMHKQLYGIAITELTAHLSRRSLYCSKTANGPYSVSKFKSDHGNILYHSVKHTWAGDKCKFCGAPKDVYNKSSIHESHAYEFIHITDNKLKELKDMKFDLIIGNPPYQLSDGGNAASASPIYQLFIENAKKLKPRYLTMIVPSRWFAGGKGLDEFREEMISDKRIRHLEDYLNANDCFGNGVEIKGGVCYFLWTRDSEGPCKVVTHLKENVLSVGERYMKHSAEDDIFVRRNEAIPFLNKIEALKEPTFDTIVSSRKPFGFPTNISTHKNRQPGDVKILVRGGYEFIQRSEITKNEELVNCSKIFITKAYNAGDDWPHQIINKPLLGEKETCCSETYLVIGPFESDIIAKNVISYIKTKFFRLN